MLTTIAAEHDVLVLLQLHDILLFIYTERGKRCAFPSRWLL
jgi:hypothetical protein